VIAARRFFVEGRREAGATVEIAGDDARKIARVLRLRAGDRIEVVDSSAKTFTASVVEVGRTVTATLLETTREAPSNISALQIDIAQAVPKAQRMDFVVEKCTELGARAFLPFYCERSVARAVHAEKLARWRRVARTATQQCGRSEIPQVFAPQEFHGILERFAGYDAVLFAWEMADAIPLYDRLRQLVPRAGSVLAVIGPEGGFTHDEAERAAHRGAELLWLGPRILRTDTAAIVLLAVIGAFAS
jgi:16S rRNA (uracil1498-N3)-methyltransferase